MASDDIVYDDGGDYFDDPDDDDRFPDDDEDGGDCHWCGGDGWVECHDPIQCTRQHDQFDLCRCSSCGGSGAAKDMTIW